MFPIARYGDLLGTACVKTEDYLTSTVNFGPEVESDWTPYVRSLFFQRKVVENQHQNLEDDLRRKRKRQEKMEAQSSKKRKLNGAFLFCLKKSVFFTNNVDVYQAFCFVFLIISFLFIL